MNTCSEPECDIAIYARGLCRKHYAHRRNTGLPLPPLPSRDVGCAVSECENGHYAKGWCQKHYNRLRTTGVEPGVTHPVFQDRPCLVEGCERPVRNGGGARGWCGYHYGKWRVHGDPLAQLQAPNGTGTTLPSGYRMVYRPGRPGAHKQGQILEHRLVMSEHLGRPLWPDEVVHHRNGDRADNRIENLELWVRSHPSGQRVEEIVAWARAMLARYDAM